MGVLVRRHRGKHAGVVLSRADQEAALHRRAIRWLGTTVVTWPIWAVTGASVVPGVTATHDHVVATLGIWPAYIMVAGLGDIARRARRLYVDPIAVTENSAD